MTPVNLLFQMRHLPHYSDLSSSPGPAAERPLNAEERGELSPQRVRRCTPAGFFSTENHGGRRGLRLRSTWNTRRSQAALCDMMIEIPSSVECGLCDVSTVRLLRRVNAERISSMAEAGELQWAWDVSSGRAVRELRFFFGEIAAPQMYARLTLDEMISKILPPSRNFFHGSEVCQILLISRPRLSQVAPEMGGTIRNRSFKVPRDGFAAWLKVRHLGRRCR